MRGGYGGMPAPGMPQMGYGYPQQGGHPMAPQLYAQQAYGRGGYPPQQTMGYNNMPQQGTFHPSSDDLSPVDYPPNFSSVPEN